MNASTPGTTGRRWSHASYDAVVIGSGPNGLSAAIELARAGLSTLLVEGAENPGGGMRTAERTLPGFHSDVCSSVHPLGAASPFFRSLPLERYGLSWVHSPAVLAHVLDRGRTFCLERDIGETAAQFEADDGAYTRLMSPFVEHADELLTDVLAGPRPPLAPLRFAGFGMKAIRSMRSLGNRFTLPFAPALLSGIAAHGMLPLDALATSSFALVLAIAGHAFGWPVAAGGSASIAKALLACFCEAGGELVTGVRVDTLDALPVARVYVCDVSPKELLRIAGNRLDERYRRRLKRFRYGPGVFKMDWALAGPVPWADERCARAATIHLSGTLEDVARAEASAHGGSLAATPFVLLVQPSLFDRSRAPAPRQTAWAYCHVPHGSTIDASEAIEAHIERFAPGFRELVLARTAVNAHDLELYDPNFVGGDIAGGASDVRQLFFRPIVSVDPYATSAPDVFLCSSSTPPGGGVHGMCGYWAAQSALRHVFGRKGPARAPEPVTFPPPRLA